MFSLIADNVAECPIAEKNLLLDIKVDHDSDIVLSRRLTSQIAMLLQCSQYQQSSLGAAVSEAVRVVLPNCHSGTVSYLLDRVGEGHAFIVEIITDGNAGCFFREDDPAFEVAKRLVDDLCVTVTDKGTAVTLKKDLSRLLPAEEIETVRGRLKNRKPENLMEELQLQNQELIKALEIFQNQYQELLRIQMSLEESHSLLLKTNENLKETATRDPLTGLLNRLRFKDIFHETLDNARQVGGPFSIILFDVDNFKRINDTCGHSAGDRVLVGISDLVSIRLRKQDWFFRLGGEEFVIIPCNCNIKGATSLARQLKESIANQCFDDLRVTCSFGVATYREGDDYESILDRVDAAMYTAKEAGKNTVQVLE